MADDKHGKHEDQDFDASASGADEPTAMWDAEELRKLGLNELGPEPSISPPATRPGVQSNAATTAPSIVVDPRATGAHRVAPPATSSKELSWPATVSIAVALGGAVYALIRLVL